MAHRHFNVFVMAVAALAMLGLNQMNRVDTHLTDHVIVVADYHP